MKSPLGKLRKLGLSKSEPEENWDHHISAHVDGLIQASKDMKYMRTCYDGLLSAAAATANSAYEFSESLLEMGNCLLEKTVVHDDGESGVTLSQLGRVQFELQKLVDSYRSQIVMTITHPSESLLSELRKVEEMKLQCDEKKEMLEYMVGQFREKGKSRSGKGKTFTPKELQAVGEEYDEAARLCVFRVASLKQGQCRSLLTQAARHHAAQLNFFRKGLQSLEAVDPHIRNVAEKLHIDYELSELNDGSSFETNKDGELSFESGQNNMRSENTSAVRNSMELDPSSQVKSIEDQMLSQQHRAVSHSAPLYAEKSEKTRQVQKLNRHILPTPDNAKGSTRTLPPKNQWHSSPLDIENTNKKHSLPLPRPVAEHPLDTQIKRQAFSGPLVSKPSSYSSKPILAGELHELPRPPDSFGSKSMRYGGALQHSAPLIPPTYWRNTLRQGSPLPLPQLTVSRSFSIPTSSHRTRVFNSGKLLDSSQILNKPEEAHSPPLTPIYLSNMK